MTAFEKNRGSGWLLASVAATALAAAPRIVLFLRVDACLDDAGAWDYGTNRCRFDVAALPGPSSQPFSPFSIALLLVAAVCLLVAWGKRHPRRT